MDSLEHKIRDYITRLNPNRLDLKSKPNSIKIKELKTNGLSHRNFLITIDNKKFLLRLSTRRMRHHYHLSYEYFVLRYIEKYGLSPKSYILSKGSAVGHSFIILDYVEGKPLKHFNTAQLKELAQIVAHLHTIRLSRKIRGKFNDLSTQQKALADSARRLKLTEKFFTETKEKKRFFCELTNAYTKIAHSKGYGKQVALIHLDIALENIILSKKGLKIIDWERTSQGDPYYDIATLFDRIKLNYAQKRIFIKEYSRVSRVRYSNRLLNESSKIRNLDRMIWAIREIIKLKTGVINKYDIKNLKISKWNFIGRKKFDALKELKVIPKSAMWLNSKNW